MITLDPVTLEGNGIRLEPLGPQHAEVLATAASDGELWNLWYTFVPRPEETPAYVHRPRRDRIHVVREAMAGDPREHDVQAASLRGIGLRRGVIDSAATWP